MEDFAIKLVFLPAIVVWLGAAGVFLDQIYVFATQGNWLETPVSAMWAAVGSKPYRGTTWAGVQKAYDWIDASPLDGALFVSGFVWLGLSYGVVHVAHGVRRR